MTSSISNVPRRLLSDSEVTAIFDSVKNGSTLAPHFKFQVIAVDPAGSKISPPRQQFQDGLYILCDIHNPTIPKHLLELVSDGPPETSSFRWHPASGRSPNASETIRMRNCYRFTNEGDREEGVRGYLWTMLSSNGKEDLKYRLLHVYPEPFDSTATKRSSKDATSKPKKKKKRSLPTRKSAASNDAAVQDAPQKKDRTKTRPSSRPSSVVSTVPCTLSEEDVAAIFASVKSNRKPPPHLTYQVICVDGSNGKQVTPPQLQYKDGLYIFCDKKCPKHLRPLLPGDVPPPATKFRWNVSGPRLWSSKTLFIRSCNAWKKQEGTPYGKCGAIYTQVVNGKEDLQYRLLHIHAPVQPSERRKVKKKHTRDRKMNGDDGCEICGKEGHVDCLMECNGCENGYCHTFCLGLTALPSGDWFCKTCMPRKRPAKGKAHGPQKKKSRRKHQTESVGDGEQPAIVSSESSESLEHAIHYKLIRRQNNDPAEEPRTFSLDEQLGFFVMDSRDASFATVRAAIAEEVDADSLPGNAWKFDVPSLGLITAKQEQLLGPVAGWLEKTFGDRLGDGSSHNPFRLFLSL